LRSNVPGGHGGARWNLCYHGTTSGAVLSVIMHGQLLCPGDVLLSGEALRVRDCHIPDQRRVYTTPSLKYAEAHTYATPFTHGGREWKVVIECRILPDDGAFDVMPQTFSNDPAFPDIDKGIPNCGLEWVTERRMAVIPVAILLRPWEANKERLSAHAPSGPVAAGAPPPSVPGQGEGDANTSRVTNTQPGASTDSLASAFQLEPVQR
jgi:hypothetical protein